MMETLEYVALRIIQEQELIIGPVAWMEARKIVGLHIEPNLGIVTITGDNPKKVIEELVQRYTEFFGTSVQETFKQALRESPRRTNQ